MVVVGSCAMRAMILLFLLPLPFLSRGAHIYLRYIRDISSQVRTRMEEQERKGGRRTLCSPSSALVMVAAVSLSIITKQCRPNNSASSNPALTSRSSSPSLLRE